MLAACKVCLGQDIKLLYRSRRHGFRVARCAGCGSLFVLDDVPTAKLTEIYNANEAYHHYIELIDEEKVRSRHYETIAEIQGYLADAEQSSARSTPWRLFDIGAGSGEFLALARSAGFEVHGNEISTVAVRLAWEKHNIHLSLEPLDQDPRSSFFDVITMWSLIEHVQHPRLLIEQAARLLRPGGILFVYTPVWCLYDAIGLLLARMGWSRLLDRRISWAHLHLFSRRALEQMCARAGFDVLDSLAVCEYSFSPAAYVEQLGVPSKPAMVLGRFFSWLIDHRLFFRNNIRLFCRRTDASATYQEAAKPVDRQVTLHKKGKK